MIRQTVSCDICGTEKQQTNRWFVAQDQGEELCISGWNSQKFLSPGAKHLCGHTCMQKLVDEFMDRTRADQAASHTTVETVIEAYPVATDASLTSDAAYTEIESSARLITTPAPITPIAATPTQARENTRATALPVDDPPRLASRNWRTEAWERERKREQRDADHSTERGFRRRFTI